MASLGRGIVLMAALAVAAPGIAQQTRIVTGERYNATIWVDPDGCEHWVMDDGFEGFMSPHLRRDGTPVCRRGRVCAMMQTDPLFDSGSARIGHADRQTLEAFFRGKDGAALIVSGHTDSAGAEAANQRLSERRAEAVAQVARDVGVQVADVRGFGELRPVADNATADGRRRNRRVEVICLR